MYDSVIFDLDGTLLDTLDDLADSVDHSLRKFGFRTRSIDEIQHFIGHGIADLIRRSLPDGHTDDDFKSVFAEFREYYPLHAADKTKPYPGIVSLLEELKEKGIATAVVSNKKDPIVNSLTDSFFPGLIDISIGERDGVPKKPDPASVIEAMDRLKSSSPLYVGDSEVDLETASNAHVDCCLVTWGFGYGIKKMPAEWTADTVDDLKALFHI